MYVHGRLSGRVLATGTLLFLLTATTLPAQRTPVDLTGDWSYRKGGYTFTLKLVQRGDSLIGAHCAVTHNATRVDCAYVEEGSAQPVSLAGSIRNGTARVRFTSSYSNASGEARIVVRGRKIEWRIIQGSVSEGEYYLPMKATLTRAARGH